MTNLEEPSQESGLLLAKLPTPVAQELIEAGLAQPVPRVRAGAIVDVDLLVTISQVAATVITLAQTPAVISRLIEVLTRIRGNRRERSGRIVLKASGRHGRIELQLGDDTPVDEIARILRLLA